MGAAGSAISSIVVYYLMVKLSKKKPMRRIENSRLIQSWGSLARKLPFLSLVIFNAVPLPVDPSRFFAVFNRYSKGKYVTAISLGRFVRYFALAMLGEAFRIPNSALIVLTVALIILPFLAKKCKGSVSDRQATGVSCCQRDEKSVEL